MILIYESISKGYAHLSFDESMLMIIDNCFNDTKVYYADSTHNKLLKKKMDTCKIQFVDIPIPDLKNKVKAVMTEVANQVWMKWRNRKNKITHVILTNSPAHTVFLVKLLYRKCKITCIIHGTLEECNHKKHFYELGYYNKPSLKFKNDDKRIKYIVLGNSIKENALKIIPEIEKNLYSVPLPHNFDNIPKSRMNGCIKINRKLKIGTIGSGCKSKGTGLIFEIENRLKNLAILGKSVDLHHVGRLSDVEIVPNSQVILCTQTDMLSEEEYDRSIMELDYILFLFPPNSYKLSASGALLDAIKFRKPIIALRNDYFQYVFDSVGEIGYLCDSMDDIIECILDIVNTGIYPQPQGFLSNIETAIQIFDYRNVEKEIKNLKIWE